MVETGMKGGVDESYDRFVGLLKEIQKNHNTPYIPFNIFSNSLKHSF
jgi:hypothetical protein